MANSRRNSARKTRSAKTRNSSEVSDKKVSRTKDNENRSIFEKLQKDVSENQSYLNLVLGALIVIVLGILLFNYFNKPSSDLGPSDQTENTETQTGDVSKDDLPGNYTVKEGDTLYTIAQKYYDNGNSFARIMEENKLPNENEIHVGQVLTIPTLEENLAQASGEPSSEPSSSPPTEPTAEPSALASPQPSVEPSIQPSTAPEVAQNPNEQPSMGAPNAATGGAENVTIWGEKITGKTYTVQAGDWLSKIAGRAYGDIMAYQKIASANNIQNPDTIEVGTVLRIPR